MVNLHQVQNPTEAARQQEQTVVVSDTSSSAAADGLQEFLAASTSTADEAAGGGPAAVQASAFTVDSVLNNPSHDVIATFKLSEKSAAVRVLSPPPPPQPVANSRPFVAELVVTATPGSTSPARTTTTSVLHSLSTVPMDGGGGLHVENHHHIHHPGVVTAVSATSPSSPPGPSDIVNLAPAELRAAGSPDSPNAKVRP